MTQISLSLKSSLVNRRKWILHPPERPPHSVLTHPCSQVCVSVVMSKAGKETLRQADWFRNFKKENWLLRIQYTTSKLVIFASRSWLGWEGLTGEHMFVLPFSAFQQINHRRHLPHPVLSHPCSCSWILRAGETSAFLSLLSRRWVEGEGEQELGSSSCHSPSGGKQTIACVVPLQ